MADDKPCQLRGIACDRCPRKHFDECAAYQELMNYVGSALRTQNQAKQRKDIRIVQ